MKSIVCVKQVYDVSSELLINDGRILWGDAPAVINPWDELAVEAALVVKERLGGEVIALTIGGDNGREALKTALAMGCDRAVLIEGSEQSPGDTLSAAAIVAAAVRKMEDVDLVFFGKQASDTETGVLAVQTARKLHWPVLTLVSAIDEVNEEQKKINAVRTMEEGRQSVTTKLPAVLSINKDFGQPRYPSFIGTKKASRAVIPTLSLSELELTIGSTIVYQGVEPTPEKDVHSEIIQGDSPDEIASKLVARLVEDRIL